MSKSFTEMNELNDGTIMIVDSINLAFRFKHAKSTDFIDSYLNLIESLKKSYKATKVIIACDKGQSSFRLGIYPEYKANRRALRETQTDLEKEEFMAFFEEFNHTMDACAEIYPLLRFEGVEADDIAAYLCKILPKKYSAKNIWLISSDKDYDLLVNDTTSRFSYVTRKETTIDNWEEHYDCTPEQYISIKCLTGDSGDNVKGVEGIGPKRASDLVKQYGTIFDIIAELPIASKYKYILSLNESKDKLLLNCQLMDLVTYCEDAIGKDNCLEIHRRLDEYLLSI
jgi:5'-3' exonuclease